MTALDVFGLGLYGLRARRLRSALSAIGIAIGIAAMVSVSGIAESSRAGVLAQLDQLGTNLLTVTPGHSFGGDAAVLPAEATGMIRRVKGVQTVTATAPVSASVYRNDHVPPAQTGGMSVLAAEPDLLANLGATMQQGVFLNAATARYPAVVLGSFAARHLGIDQVSDGVAVWLGGRWFTVVGILNPVTLAPEIDSAALVGWGVSATLFGFEGHPGTEYVRTDPSLVTQVESLLAGASNPAHPEQVQVSRPSDALAARAVANTAFTTLLLGLGSVALLVGAIGVANVMIIAVLERRSEVGLRRALGATRSLIGAQFVIEAAVLSFTGGAAGCALGALATAVYAVRQQWLIDVPPVALAGGLGGAVLIGVVAGAYPALRAARLAPTEALRNG